MKYFVAAVVLLIIIGLPAGSYYYLNAGFNYQKKSVKELRVKANLIENGVDSTLVFGKTSVISKITISNKELLLEYLTLVEDQFDDTYSFQNIVVGDSILCLDFVNKDFVFIRSNQMPQNLFTNDKMQLLVDVKANVRYYYKDNVDAFNKMVEHIAIVLPRAKELDISMKKYESQ